MTLLCSSSIKLKVIWKGWWGLLYDSPTFPLLRASHGRMLVPCVYSANNKVCRNYYAQRKKMCDRRELNPRPRLWCHTKGPSSASPTIKSRWYGRGEGASYAIVQQSLNLSHNIANLSYHILHTRNIVEVTFCQFTRSPYKSSILLLHMEKIIFGKGTVNC
jgi:hypothetical protein